MSSAIQQEYEEGMSALGEQRMKFYKILSLFSFENGNEIHFGDNLSTFCDDKEHYTQFKEYVKEQKKIVRNEALSDIPNRLWWLKAKMIELGLFSASELRTVFLLFDA